MRWFLKGEGPSAELLLGFKWEATADCVPDGDSIVAVHGLEREEVGQPEGQANVLFVWVN